MKKKLAICLLTVTVLSYAGCSITRQSNTNTNEASAFTTSEAAQENNAFSSSSQSEAKGISDNDSSPENIFDLNSFSGDEIFDIEKSILTIGDADYRSDIESKCETYEFYYPSDGYNIKAIISIPTSNIRSQKQCKCLLYNRGGHWDYGYLSEDMLAKLCSLTGRVVVACEIRGGNGSEGFDQFGGDELHDVFRLIDLCEDKLSFINMEDFCVLGESRGGMMTYMTAREDKRVKKIITAGGVSDLFSTYEKRDDMKQVLCSCLGGTPEEKPEEYKKRSAVYWADEINIPVLIIHSKGDEKVDYKDNAAAIYDKLKDSTDCTLITNEGNYHGINPSKDSEDITEIIKFLSK